MESNVHYEVWWGAITMRHRKADTEEDAREIAARFAAEGHPVVNILKVTVTKETVD